MLSPEWRCSWSNVDRRCCNFIWVITYPCLRYLLLVSKSSCEAACVSLLSTAHDKWHRITPKYERHSPTAKLLTNRIVNGEKVGSGDDTILAPWMITEYTCISPSHLMCVHGIQCVWPLFAAWLTVLYAHKQAYRRYTAHRRNATFASDMHLTLLLSYSIFSLTVKTKCTNYRPNIHALTFCLIIGLLWHDVNGLRHYIENIRQ